MRILKLRTVASSQESHRGRRKTPKRLTTRGPISSGITYRGKDLMVIVNAFYYQRKKRRLRNNGRQRFSTDVFRGRFYECVLDAGIGLRVFN